MAQAAVLRAQNRANQKVRHTEIVKKRVEKTQIIESVLRRETQSNPS